MNNNLSAIDYACQCTTTKYGLEQTKAALAIFTRTGQPNYFTKDNNGRATISNVGQEMTEAELLKNIIKLKATKTMNGIRQILSSNKSIDRPDLTPEEFEYLMYSLLSNYDLESIKYILNKYPHLFNSLAISFVNSRYTQQRYTKNDIDSDYKNDPHSIELLNKIDQFYGSTVQQNSVINAQKGN